MEASSALVIKVKYGAILRRFNAQIVEEDLVLSMNKLKERILSLLNFTSDTELILTYLDKDGDVVNLVDDDDLRDVVKQGLNPLTITVELSFKKARHQLCSRGNSTPLKSHQVQHWLAGVTEILKMMPEPLCERLLKLATDLASKAFLSVPAILELGHYFMKMGLSYLGEFSEFQTRVEPSTNRDPVEKETKETKISEISATIQKVPLSGIEAQASQSHECLTELQPEAPIGNYNRDLINATERKLGTSSKWHYLEALSSDIDPRDYTIDEVNKPDKPYVRPKTAYIGADDPRKPSGSSLTCPFSSLSDGISSAATFRPVSMEFPFRSSRGQNATAGTGTDFRQDACCDGYSLHPKTGARVKSTVKAERAPCSVCFWKMCQCRASILPQVCTRCSKMKSQPTKLDSCFIKDVNVFDRTVMAPSTPFTKIWRIRNNGMAVWPQKTCLVWIDGHMLRDEHYVELEILAAGLPVGNELDVAVDFIAPERPGQYKSYWRMVSPTGQKFGYNVWVLIQVNASTKDILCPAINSSNPNITLVSSGLPGGPEISNLDTARVTVDSQAKPDNSGKKIELAEPVVELESDNSLEEKLLFNYILTDVRDASSSVSSAICSFSYPSSSAGSISNSPGPATRLSVMTETEKELMRELEELGFKLIP